MPYALQNISALKRKINFMSGQVQEYADREFIMNKKYPRIFISGIALLLCLYPILFALGEEQPDFTFSDAGKATGFLPGDRLRSPAQPGRVVADDRDY